MPDIPLEETHTVREVCNKHGIELVLLATPTTPIERMSRIAKASQVGASTGREECIPPATSTEFATALASGIHLSCVCYRSHRDQGDHGVTRGGSGCDAAWSDGQAGGDDLSS